MLTNNYYTMLSSYYLNDNLNGVNTVGESGGYVPRDMNGLSSRVNEGNTSGYSGPNAGKFMLLGTGTTPPTIDDYRLASFVGLTVVSSNHTYYAKKGRILIYTRTFVNSTSEAITITELGMYIGGVDNMPFLIAREVLSEPVVIQPEESKAFTFTLK